MTDLNVDELYADVIASASPTGFIRKTLRDLVGKVKTDDVFVPHDVSLNVVRSDRTALLYVEPNEGWAALLMRTVSGERRREMAFHWPEAGVCRIGPHRIAFSIPADIDEVAVELEREGWTIMPVIPGWITRANVVPLDHERFRGEAFRHAVTRSPLSSERKGEIKRRQQERSTEQRGKF
ncbi:hypothetical protein C0Z18_02060 [Trinickia dabaoshanensis]|uniref:Uncharacterized protein n=1 Tax=Trinickia dabaoshanensis TaxID=564714 RepID=A0A2N7W0T2_9BURK|nr:hypothetical protein [Trinickia dabaoshanensis]PMS23029.1 hypothetical protein C0Z18_02060 [Trinickia dabaoshanensis]